jgi:hypothetical protein
MSRFLDFSRHEGDDLPSVRLGRTKGGFSETQGQTTLGSGSNKFNGKEGASASNLRVQFGSSGERRICYVYRTDHRCNTDLG